LNLIFKVFWALIDKIFNISLELPTNFETQKQDFKANDKVEFTAECFTIFSFKQPEYFDESET